MIAKGTDALQPLPLTSVCGDRSRTPSPHVTVPARTLANRPQVAETVTLPRHPIGIAKLFRTSCSLSADFDSINKVTTP
jgi:hypothetical protein